MLSYNGGQVHVISHVDIDGHCAAAVVKQHYPEASVVLTNYNKQLHLSRFKNGDTVFVTDFSLSKEVFEILVNRNIKIVWCDHHRSALETLKGTVADRFDGIRSEEYSGAMLTWMYFNSDKTFDQAPYFIKLVNWYDLWQHDKDPNIRPFVYGVGLWDTRPGYVTGDRLWNTLFSNSGEKFFNNILTYGKTVQNYVEKYQDTLCKDLAYRTTLRTNNGDRKLLAMMIRTGNSSIFERQDTHDIDGLFIGQYFASLQQYRCSVYSPDNKKEILDIAQMFGGGGHPTAAGFTVPRYPIDYPVHATPIPLRDAVKMYEDIADMRRASPILKRYVDKSSVVGARVTCWFDKFCNWNALVFNNAYLPDTLHMLPSSIDPINPESGEVADIYIGYVMTNSGYYRCCAYPTSTSLKAEDMLQIIQAHYMKQIGAYTNKMELINGGVWWYQEEEPVTPKITFNLPSASVN